MPFAPLRGYGLHRDRSSYFFFGFFTSTSTLPPPGVRTVFFWPGFTLTFFTFVTSTFRFFASLSNVPAYVDSLTVVFGDLLPCAAVT